MAVALGVAAIGAWAVSTERVSYDITHGVSMEPLYHQGDLIFIAKSPSYHVGQIVAYHGSTPGLVVLHRIIGGDERGWIFKGDNNQSADPLRPSNDKLIGRAVLHLPKGGLWLGPVLSPTGLGMLGFMLVGGGGAAIRNRRDIPRGRRKKKVKAMSGGGGGGGLRAALLVLRAIRTLPPWLQVLSLVSAVAGVVGVALAVIGWMGPVSRPVAGVERSVTFSYSATVPKSPAYDGTTVSPPDPVFRKLAKMVTVQASYRGQPGSMALLAKLSDGTGWHTTIPLAGPTRFQRSGYTAAVTLDLPALEGRQQAAARAIGTVPGQLVVQIVAQVTGTSFSPFTATLKTNLNPMAFSLAESTDNLVVKDAAIETNHLEPRVFAVLGHDIVAAGTARVWAARLLLFAVLGAVAVAVAGLRFTPVRTGPEIRRRYGRLLVAVEPMASPPGKPVVNVDNFPALVKLADRYGQMILTWRRPDADDFVVRDEGITYRYRVLLDEPTLQNVELINRPGAGSHRRKASSPSQVS